MKNLDFPFHFDGRGRTALASDGKHIYDLIEQLLFTRPGERVNRPDFGTGILRLLFEGNSPEVATPVRLGLHASLQRWLGDLIEVRQVEDDSTDAVLSIVVSYAIRRTGEVRKDTFEQRKTS